MSHNNKQDSGKTSQRRKEYLEKFKEPVGKKSDWMFLTATSLPAKFVLMLSLLCTCITDITSLTGSRGSIPWKHW